MTETLSLLSEIFSPSGLLSRLLTDYEPRDGQRAMAETIWSAFEGEKGAIFEAGTGIGKSLAYLVPAILWSYQTGEKVVVSTHTISLQEQLIEKDIPLLLDALGLDLRVILAKGMGNYVCLKKLDELEGRMGFDPSLDELVTWAKKTSDGSRSSLPFVVSGNVWTETCAESDACAYVKCPHYKECFFFKERSKAQVCDVIVVNHHLLMAHLLADEGRAILPSFARLIIDEAHHLESVATHALTQTLDRVRLFKILARIHTDGSTGTSRLYHIRDAVKDKALKGRFDVDLPGQKRELVEGINEAFDQLDRAFFAAHLSQKVRITDEELRSSSWAESLTPTFSRLKDALHHYGLSLEGVEQEISDEVFSKVEHALADIKQAALKLRDSAAMIEAFFAPGDLRFVEKTAEGMSLTVANLDIAAFLGERLFTPLKTPVLCSATLAVEGHFQHVREALGLTREILEATHPSPFDFLRRTRLMGIADMPAPSSHEFIAEAAATLREAIAISGGGAFVLFTSYDMLEKCAAKLGDLDYLKQGDRSRHLLLEQFKEQGDAVLLGTDSFWEGVDVPGNALRLVIIVKLPFPVPSDPFLQARAERLTAEGKNPFTEYAVPKAVTKFKQGFGRLMRRKGDRGCVLCLDNRLFSKTYGKSFLNSLPECVVSYRSKSQIFSEMEGFFGA